MSPSRVLLLCALAAVACEGRVSPPDAIVRPDPPAVATRWVRAEAAHDFAAWECPGVARVDGQGSGEVSAAVRVRVLRVLVQVGDRVEAGAPVLEVEAPDVLRALAARGAASGRAAPLRRWRIELEAQRAAGVARASELREVEARLAQAESDLRVAEADVRASGFASADLSALERLGRAPLRSPISGVVSAVSAVTGRVSEASQAPLAEIVSERPARVEVRVMRPWPRGAELRFVTPAGQELALDPAPINEITDPTTGGRVAWFRVAVASPLAPGATGRVVVSGVPGAAVEVPARALLREDGGAWVLLRDGATGRRARVEVIAVTAHRAIIGGVAAGVEVAAEADQHPKGP